MPDPNSRAIKMLRKWYRALLGKQGLFRFLAAVRKQRSHEGGARRRGTLRGAAVSGFLVLSLLGGRVAANPNGESVAAGSASFQRSGQNLTVTQNTNKLIVNWQNFSIAAGEMTRFIQPGPNAAALNRVMSGNPSQIYGTLKANGQIYLVNPNGIVVGPGGVIDTQSFIASTLNIADSDFLDGGDMTFVGDSDAAVQNLGSINALGGDVFLIATAVENSGTISAPDGTVGLAAGGEVLLADGDSRGLLVRSAAAGGDVGVENAGVIEATRAELQAAGGNMYSLAIKNSGTIRRATGAVEQDGQVLLTADSGTVSHGGTIESAGGVVEVTGGEVILETGSTIDVSGETGGRVLVGGDFHGAGPLANAESVFVADGAAIHADGIDGDGGEVAVWSDGTTAFHGLITATGGGDGDGGFVEVSGKQHLVFDGTVDTTAENGRTGTLLLDPTNVTIVDGGGGADDGAVADGTINGADGGGADFTISEAALEGIAATTNIIVEALENITIEDLSDDVLDLATTGSVTFTADSDGDGSGTFAMFPSDTIATDGATLTISGAAVQTGGLDTTGAAGSAVADIDVTSTAGRLVLGGAVTSNGAVNLTAGGGDQALVINAPVSAGADSIFTADRMAINDTVGVGANILTLQPETANRAIDLGSIGVDAWYDPKWSYRIAVTVDDTQVDGDQADFPVYVDLDDMPDDFFTNVDAGGADIRVTAADGATELAREVVSIDTVNKTGEMHFKADALSGGSDTTFYVYYGNAGAAEPDAAAPNGAQAVWGDYTMVQHLNEKPVYPGGAVTQEAMDGTDGGFAVLRSDGVTFGSATVACDEDQLADDERGHTDEQFGAWTFADSDFDILDDTSAAIGEVLVVDDLTGGWTTVTLRNTYTSPVIVATRELESGDDSPAVVRIDNVDVAGGTFDAMLQDIGDGSDTTVPANVHFLVVEAGTHTLPGGTPLEAGTVLSDGTNENGNWNSAQMEQVTPSIAFSGTPVVLGQVMSYNDTGWSAFWSSDGNSANPPSAANIYVGKEVAEDPDTTRNDETLGYVLLDTSTGTTNGVEWDARLSGDFIEGVDDGQYNIGHAFTASNRTFADSSAGGADGTQKNFPLGVTGHIGDAVEFDGRNDWIDLGVTSLGGAFDGGSTSFTLSGWIQPELLGTDTTNHSIHNCFFSRSSNSANDNFEIGVNPDGRLDLYFDTKDGGGDNTRVVGTAGDLAAGAMHHVTVTYDAGTVSVYLDNAGYGTTVSGTNMDNAGGAEMTIGLSGHESGGTKPFDGEIDELRVSTLVRSAGWVGTEYNNQSNPGGFFSAVGAQGTTAAGDTLQLSAAELDNITAGTLRIGSATAGPIQVTGPVAPAGTDTLSLISGGAVGQTAGSTITETNLAVDAAGAVTLDQGNDAGTLAVNAGGNVHVADVNDLGVGTVDGVAGIDAGADDITLDTTGSLTQTAPVSGAGLELLGGAATLDHAGNDVDTLAANLTDDLAVADADDLGVGTVDGTSGITTAGGTVDLTADTLHVVEDIDTTAAGGTGGGIALTATTAINLGLMENSGALQTDGGTVTLTGPTFVFNDVAIDTEVGGDSAAGTIDLTAATVRSAGYFEAGSFVTQDGNWVTVNFRDIYIDPVVVATANTQNGSEVTLISEVRNVTATSAEVRVAESEGTPGVVDTHDSETVGYFVFDAAYADVIPGIEAGTFDIGDSLETDRQTVTFNESFAGQPVVLATVQTTNGLSPIEVRVTDTSMTDFEAGIGVQNGNNSVAATHAVETVGWIAIDPANLPSSQSRAGIVLNAPGGGGWNNVVFGPAFDDVPAVIAETQTEDGTERLISDGAQNVTATGAQVRFVELDTPDTADNHSDNDVGWMACDQDAGTATVTLRLDAGGTPPAAVQTGVIETGSRGMDLVVLGASFDRQGTSDVDTLAANLTGALTFTDADDLLIGTVDGTSGITAAGNVSLDVGTTLAQTQPIDAPGLEIIAGSATLENPANDIDTIAADIAGSLSLTDTVTNDLVIGTVGGTAGVSVGGAATLNVAGALTQTDPVVAGTLEVLADAVTLEDTGNDVNIIAANVTNAFSYTDADTFAVATAGGTSGITAGGGVDLLSAGIDTGIGIFAPVTAGGDSSIIADRIVIQAAVDVGANTLTLAPSTGSGDTGDPIELVDDVPTAIWYDPNWSYRVKVTVDPAGVDGDQADFPVYVDLADMPADFFTNVDGSGADIRVTTADGYTELPREVVSIDTVGDTGELHFKADQLSGSAATSFYVYCGNGGAAEPAADSTYGSQNVWTAGYAMVQHLEDATGGIQADSSANGRDGVINGGVTTNVQGTIGGADQFDGSTGWVDIPNDFGIFDGASSFTVTMWLHDDAWPTNSNWSWSDAVFTARGENAFMMTFGDGLNPASQLGSRTDQAGAGWRTHVSSDPLVDGNWYQVSTSFDPATGWNFFQNGLVVDSDGNTNGIDGSGTDNGFGAEPNSGSDRFFDGIIDELRVSTVARTTGWAATAYNNQSAPGTFYGAAADLPAANVLQLSDAELNRVTAGTLRVGDADSGTVAIANDVSPAGVSTAMVMASRTVPADGVTVTAPQLVIEDTLSVAGDANAGLLTVDGDLTFGPAATLHVTLSGTTARTEHDQVVVTSGNNLAFDTSTGTVITGEGTHVYDTGDALTVVDNLSGAADGTSDSTVTITGQAFDVDEPAAGGNDLVLGRIATTWTWDGDAAAGGDWLWSTAANWLQDAGHPGDGDAVIFPDGDTEFTSPDNDLVGLALDTITVTDTGAADNGYGLGGNTLTLSGGIDSQSSAVQTIDMPLLLAADQSFTAAGGGLAFGGTIDGDGNGPWALDVTTNSGAAFGGAVGSTAPLAGLTVTGPAAIDGGAVTTTGGQTYNDAVTLGADTTLTGGGSLAFVDTLDGDGNGPWTLDAAFGDAVAFGGAVGGTTPPAGMTVAADGDVIVAADVDLGSGGLALTSDADTNGAGETHLGVNTAAVSLTTAGGDMTFTGPVFLDSQTVNLDTGAGGGAVTFNDTVAAEHFYVLDTTNRNYAGAQANAASTTYNGMTGYLATITSDAENTEAHNTAGSNEFLFGASDAGSEGVWRWIEGPEQGLQFWQGGSGGTAVAGMYDNWDGAQPNNWSGSPTGQQDYVEGNYYEPATRWQDVDATHSQYSLIEYGGTQQLNIAAGTGAVVFNDTVGGDTTVTGTSVGIGRELGGLTVSSSGAAAFNDQVLLNGRLDVTSDGDITADNLLRANAIRLATSGGSIIDPAADGNTLILEMRDGNTFMGTAGPNPNIELIATAGGIGTRAEPLNVRGGVGGHQGPGAGADDNALTIDVATGAAGGTYIRGIGGPGTPNTIYREWWLDIGNGTSVSDLTGDPDYPDNPDGADELGIFQYGGWNDRYGQRFRGYIEPDQAGDYTFWIVSDDNSELWLSSDADPANAQLVSNVTNWAGWNNWNDGDVHSSDDLGLTLTLDAGRRYYVEALHKEGTGGDHVQVFWERNSDPLNPNPAVIGGQYLRTLFDSSIENPLPGTVNDTLNITTVGATAGTTAGGDVLFDVGAGLTQDRPIVGDGFELLSETPIALQDPGNDVNTMAADIDGSLHFVDADDLAIGTVGYTSGLTATGDVTLDVGGALTQTDPIAAPGLEIIAGSATLENAGNDVDTVAANTGGAISFVDADDLLVGIVGTTSGITTVGNVTLDVGTDLTQTQPIDAPGLAIIAGSATLENAGNDIDVLAANIADSLSLTDTVTDDLAIGTVGGTAGVTVGGDATLNVAGALTQTDPVTASSLELLADAVTLENIGNDVDVIAANVTNAFSFTDADTFAVATAGSTTGITAGGGVDLLSAGVDTAIGIFQPITAGGDSSIIADRIVIQAAVDVGANTLTLAPSTGSGDTGDPIELVDDVPTAIWYDPNWSYRIKVTVDPAGVDGDQADFPVYVDLADMPADFFTNVDAAGADIRVTAADGTTELPLEVVSIDGGGGTGEMHFRADQLSGSAATSFYVYCGNGAAAGYAADDTFGAQNVWNAGTTMVQHLNEDPATAGAGGIIDSTANAYDGTSTGGTLIGGVVGDAFNADGDDDYVTVSPGMPIDNRDFSVSFWAKRDSTNEDWAIGHSTGGGNSALHIGFRDSNTFAFAFWGNDLNIGGIAEAGDTTNAHHWVCTYDAATNLQTVYLDGAQIGTRTAGADFQGTGDFYIGKRRNDLGGQEFHGFLDEVRVSGVARTAGWTATAYNNQSAPGTFYAAAADAGPAANVLQISDAELDLVTAGTLRVGDASAGGIAVNAPVSPAGTDTLTLISGGAVDQSAGSTITETNLAVDAAGTVTLEEPNGVGTLAINAGGAVSFVDADDLTIGVVDGIAGITTTSDTIAVTAGGDDNLLTIDRPIDTDTTDTTGANVDLTADKMAVNAGVDAVGNTITVAPESTADAGDGIDLGSATDAAADTLELSDAELDWMTAGTLRVGDADTGTTALSADIGPANIATAMVMVSRTVPADGVTVTVPQLVIEDTLSVAGDATAGLLTVDGDLTFNASSTLYVTLDGLTAETEYDQTEVTNGNDLIFDGAVAGEGTYVYDTGDTLTVIDNLSGAADGTSDSTVTITGQSFAVDEPAAGGNDLVLGRIATTWTWDGDAAAGGDWHWSTAANWLQDAGHPGGGDDVVFPDGDTEFASPDNDLAGLALDTITVTDTGAADNGYGLIGNTVTLTAGIDSQSSAVQTIDMPLLLAADQSFTAAGGGLAFGGTIDGDGNGSWALDVDTDDGVAFGGVVGGIDPLAGLDVTGPAAINGGAVTTTGDQTYNDDVVLGADAVLTGNDLTFNDTLDGDGNGPWTFDANFDGVTAFNGIVGGNTALGSVTTDAPGATAINGGAVTTTGDQTYNDTVTLGVDAVLTGNDLTFNDTLDGPGSLDADFDGVTAFNGIVGGNTALGSVTTDAPGATEINGGAVTTTGDQVYNDSLALGADTTLTVDTAGGVDFNNTADNDAPGTPRDLTIGGAGLDTVSFDGAVGGINGPLDVLSVDADGTVTQTAPLNAAGLELRGPASVTLDDGANDFDTLAANTTNTLDIADTDDLAIGTVGGTPGVATGGNDVTLATGGTLTLGDGAAGEAVDAGGATVMLSSAADIQGAADDGVADILGGTIDLVAAAGGIGTASPVELFAATLVNADTTADGSDIVIDSVGDLPVGTIRSGPGNVTLTGDTGADTLIGPDADNTWTLTGPDSGILDDGVDTFDFFSFEDIAGGGADDTFTIGSGVVYNGNVRGGGGTDELAMVDGTNTWDVTGLNTGTVTGIGGTFDAVESLTGGTGDDTFNIFSGARLAGDIDGGGGSDTIVQEDGANTWRINGANTGTLTDLGGWFFNMENLAGGTEADTFVFADGATLAGGIDGMTGRDEIDFSAYSTSIILTNVGGGSVDGFRAGTDGTPDPLGGLFDNIDVLTWSAAADDWVLEFFAEMDEEKTRKHRKEWHPPKRYGLYYRPRPGGEDAGHWSSFSVFGNAQD